MSNSLIQIHSPAEGPFDHGARSRFNAWFFSAFDRYINHVTRPHKRCAFADMTAGTILELGAGTGANTAYLPRGAQLLALEPNLAMHERLHARCRRADVSVTVIPGRAEQIPLPDDSVDEVICSLVLCTVSDPEQVLAEVRRVLRAGGRFRFVEHVASPRRGARQLVQRLIRRPWAWVFEGCRLDRHTPEILTRAGFTDLSLTRRRLRWSVFYPVNSAVWGIAQA